MPLLAQARQMVILVKPQFEVGRGQVGKGGIVRDPRTASRGLRSRASGGRSAGFPTAIIESPILGAEGNREFLLYAQPRNQPMRYASASSPSRAASKRRAVGAGADRVAGRSAASRRALDEETRRATLGREQTVLPRDEVAAGRATADRAGRRWHAALGGARLQAAATFRCSP